MKLKWECVRQFGAPCYRDRVGFIDLEVAPNDLGNQWTALVGKRSRSDFPNVEAAKEWAEAEIVQIVREMAFTVGLNIRN